MALVMLLVSFYTRVKQALQGLGGKPSWRAWVLEEMEDLLGEASEPRESGLLRRVWGAAGCRRGAAEQCCCPVLPSLTLSMLRAELIH